MPLTDLVEYFNQRITTEQGLAEYPLILRNGRVESHFGGDRLATEFHPIRRAGRPSLVVGHDATVYSVQPGTSQDAVEKVFQAADVSGAVNLDRLCRTVHMLNYLPVAHESGYLFLHVHPRHILGVKSDHGAYFEEVIFRCGLSPRRVVVTVPFKPVYDQQFTRLQEGLKNYQNRGYATAIKFEEQTAETLMERNCIEFLYRVTPDFIRIDKDFFSRLKRDSNEERQSTSLLAVIHGLDTEILLEGIKTNEDTKQVAALQASLVKGDYYEKAFATPLLAKTR
jgi:EAL domain-containing protein (putative c-di-GMP-specific phosphodiesterase class I)